MPHVAFVYMSPKSAFINSEISMQWLKTYFLLRKLLIVDGYTSHCNVDMLEFADEHDIIILSLPSHTTHMSQPLDRAVFKSLEAAVFGACDHWIKTNLSRKSSRLIFVTLLCQS